MVKLLLFCVQILFISIDVSQSLPNVLNYFGVSEDDAPTARIINMETGKKFNIATKKYTLESMSQLCQEVVDGTAQVNYTRARKHAHTRTYIANKYLLPAVETRWHSQPLPPQLILLFGYILCINE